jgi:DNA-binding NarL/FixJ family response regulator
MEKDPKRILIVDDNVDFLDVLKDFISLFPHLSVVTATDGEKAYQILKHSAVDVAFIELNIHGMNGIELLNKIKSEFNQIFVVIFTDGLYGSNLSVADAKRLGVDLIIDKSRVLDIKNIFD